MRFSFRCKICLLFFAFASVLDVSAQTLRLYKFTDDAKGRREASTTTRTIKTYKAGTVYREGAVEPQMEFTPFNDKWTKVVEICKGDTVTSFVKSKNLLVSDYRIENMPVSFAGRKFYGDGLTAKVYKLKTGSKKIVTKETVEGVEKSWDSTNDIKYILEINKGYFTETYPLYLEGGSLNLELSGDRRLIAKDIDGSLVDRNFRLKYNVDCVVDNSKKVLIYFLPDQSTIYYQGKFLHILK